MSGVAPSIRASITAYGVIREGLLAYQLQPAFSAVAPACEGLLVHLPPPSLSLALNPPHLYDLLAIEMIVFGIQRPIIATRPDRLAAIENYLRDTWPLSQLPTVEEILVIKELVDGRLNDNPSALWRAINDFLRSIPRLPRGISALALTAMLRFCASPWIDRLSQPQLSVFTPHPETRVLHAHDYVTNATLIQVVSSAVKVALDSAAGSSLSPQNETLSESKANKRFKPKHPPRLVPHGFPNIDEIIERSWKAHVGHVGQRNTSSATVLHKLRHRRLFPAVALLVATAIFSLLCIERALSSQHDENGEPRWSEAFKRFWQGKRRSAPRRMRLV